jgi:hypothetical protein
MASVVRSSQLVFKIYIFTAHIVKKTFIKGHESAFIGRENDFRGRESAYACKESRVSLEAVSIL